MNTARFLTRPSLLFVHESTTYFLPRTRAGFAPLRRLRQHQSCPREAVGAGDARRLHDESGPRLAAHGDERTHLFLARDGERRARSRWQRLRLQLTQNLRSATAPFRASDVIARLVVRVLCMSLCA